MGSSPDPVKTAAGRADDVQVDEGLEPPVLDTALRALVSGHPGAVVAALGDDGFRVPCPEVDELDGLQRVPLPVDRATLMDIVVPQDRLLVITAWDRAQERGMAMAPVHAVSAPDLVLQMNFLDLRHRLGVWLAVLVPDLSGAAGAEAGQAPGDLSDAVAVQQRPRTARMTKNMYSQMTQVDERTVRMLGFEPEALIGRRSLEFIHPDDHERAITSWMELLSHRRVHRIRLRHRRVDGSWLWVELDNSYVEAERSEEATVLCELTDISDEMAAHEAVRQREELFRRLAESLPAGILQVRPDGSIVYANERLAEIFGAPTRATLREQFGSVDDADQPELARAIDAVLAGRARADVEVAVSGANRQIRCLLTLSALSAPEGNGGAIISISDVTESSRLQEELRARATTDALTGCHNRAATMAYLNHCLGAGNRAGLAALFIDLDGFKAVNDRLGHAAGDRLLVEVSTRLRSVLRDGDLVGRLGGDEFLLLCPGAGDRAQATAVVRRVAEALDCEIEIDGVEVRLQASMGAAVAARGDELTADTLVARADAAMYRAKRDRCGPVLWSESGCASSDAV